MTVSRIGVILAGGQSRRMGGADKAELRLNDKRLIDHVIERLEPQVDYILISGPNDYGTGVVSVPDRADGPLGPAAGLWACQNEIGQVWPQAHGFLTVAVDTPFFPLDIYDRLSGVGCALAVSDNHWHPTLAYWSLSALADCFSQLQSGKGAALKAVAKICHSRPVLITEDMALMNVNTPEDWTRAQRYAALHRTMPD